MENKEISDNQEIKREEILSLLKKYSMPYEQWGQGETKDIEYLFREIEAGETVLIEEKGELIRNVFGVGVDVYYENKEGRLKLMETHQEFSDGRIRKRPQLESSLAEKIKAGEEPEKAAARALEEELGLKIKPEEIQFIQIDENIRDPQSYPGLKSKYIIHRFKISLPPDLFRPEGYTEDREDLKSYWQWEKQETKKGK